MGRQKCQRLGIGRQDKSTVALTIHFNMKAVGSVEWSVFSVEKDWSGDIRTQWWSTNTGSSVCTYIYHHITLSSRDLVLLAQSTQFEVMLYFQASAFHAYYSYSYLHLLTAITVHCYTLALMGTAGGK